MKERLAGWWEVENNNIRCVLCPEKCLIYEGKTGLCKVRKNIDNKLYSLVYGKPIAMNIDPIEKKPLYHFLPGTNVFSIGTYGCNMQCKFCQNWDISQKNIQKIEYEIEYYSPEQIVDLAIKNSCDSIAFTYNEPTIFGEYVLDIAKLARRENLKTVMVTNGYIMPKARNEIYKYIDSANIDVKGFTENFYKSFTGASLKNVLNTILYLKKENIHIELTTLLIDGKNDNEFDLRNEFNWISENLGNDIPLHLSAFYPAYKMLDENRTRIKSLKKAKQIAKESHLNYVYIGNIAGVDNNTYCDNCGEIIINRSGLSTKIIQKNRCKCGKEIKIIT
ncbi:MAG: AmmeMemoRadiSam system radical SAM enzyme [Candidatus Marinimicrobia bacterium]|nr:AmmeMemoRadiSam system radical SAM enzyme [Candidatus Neomarinimicrobiota bacterium]